MRPSALGVVGLASLCKHAHDILRCVRSLLWSLYLPLGTATPVPSLVLTNRDTVDARGEGILIAYKISFLTTKHHHVLTFNTPMASCRVSLVLVSLAAAAAALRLIFAAMARLEGVRIWETRPFRARYETAAFGVEWKERENKRAGRDWRRHGTGRASMVRSKSCA